MPEQVLPYVIQNVAYYASCYKGGMPVGDMATKLLILNLLLILKIQSPKISLYLLQKVPEALREKPETAFEAGKAYAVCPARYLASSLSQKLSLDIITMEFGDIQDMMGKHVQIYSPQEGECEDAPIIPEWCIAV